MARQTIALAGATGDLGWRIARELAARGAGVRAIVRPGSDATRVASLRELGAEIAEAHFDAKDALAGACAGASCLVSALSGLRDVVVEAQSALLDAAVGAGVPRFVPSDFCIDFTKQPEGWNRNLDLRREFHARLDRAPVRATSILCGAFTDMLTGEAPFVLFRFRRVLYWGDSDQLMDFTTRDDTAAFTAAAALDDDAPRFLRVAGDEISARGLRDAASEASGARFKLFRAGSLGTLETIIKVARTVAPGRDALYPAWQGMQYMHNMYSGLAKLEPLDNGRYPGIGWTTACDVLARNLASER